jgi:biopolymer transport protein ExbD/biopolymer transport protein TolR
MNVTPLVDVVLVLLIIFMVVAPHMDQDIQVTLPGIFNPDPDVEGQRAPETVTIDLQGTLYIQGEAFDLEAGAAKLTELHEAEPMKRLALRGRGQMPPLATAVVDEAGVALFREWIAQLPRDGGATDSN